MGTLGRWVGSFAAFWWDFIVGEDWRVAAGIVAALAATGGLVAADVPAWWLLPAAVIILLALSVRRGLHDARR